MERYRCHRSTSPAAAFDFNVFADRRHMRSGQAVDPGRRALLRSPAECSRSTALRRIAFLIVILAGAVLISFATELRMRMCI